MQLIPAIDLRRGRVVRLVQGDDTRRTDYGLDPRTVLAAYADAGVELVHVVDLDAAFGDPPQRPLIGQLVAEGAAIELGGGLRDRDAVAWALGEGCHRVILGSMVAEDFPRFAAIAAEFPDRVVPALEVAAGELRIAGWKRAAARTLDDLCAELRGLPCPAVLVTDVERDGTLAGPNLDLVRRVGEQSGLPAIVSGGIRALSDLEAAAATPGVAATIVGKALYEGIFTLGEALAAVRAGGPP